MRKIICLIMVVLLFCATCVPVMAEAQEIESSGITWELTDNDTKLTISGTGDMPDFRTPLDRPWHNVANTIITVIINSGVTSIGQNAFSWCTNLQNVTIPSSVTNIGDVAFSSCRNLQNVTIPSSVTSIGYDAFANCSSLQSITIPSSVTNISDNAFMNCQNLQSITIPSSVTSIGYNAFAACGRLQSISIPSSVTSIGYNAFVNCRDLKSLIFRSSTPPVCSGTVQLRGVTVYVPYGAIDEYKANITWDASIENSISEAYMVDILPAQNGTITVSKDFFVASKYKEANETVQVDVIPDEGYQLKSLVLSDAETTTDITEEMSFAMPCDNVTLTAEFELAENEVGSFISEGNLTIIVSIAAAAVIAIAAIVILKKKQNV